MKYVICQVSVSPLRAEPSDRSEMVSQVLFGEKAEILETKKSWIKLKADFDGYEGWADSKHFLEVPEEEYSSIRIDKFASESFNLAVENNTPLTLPIGSVLPNLNNGKIKFGHKEIDYLGECQTGNSTKSDLPELAMMYLNTPYLWGGKSVFGIDCS